MQLDSAIWAKGSVKPQFPGFTYPNQQCGILLCIRQGHAADFIPVIVKDSTDLVILSCLITHRAFPVLRRAEEDLCIRPEQIPGLQPGANRLLSHSKNDVPVIL